MPIEGVLPKVLENMLVTILSSHSVKNWSIFDESNGCVSLRLKFSPMDSSECQGHNVHSVSYKRKSQSQMKRDNERAASRKNVIQVQTAENDSSSKPSCIEMPSCETSMQYENDMLNSVHGVFVPPSQIPETKIEDKIPSKDTGTQEIKPTDEEAEDTFTFVNENEERIATKLYKYYRCFQHLPVAKNFAQFCSDLTEYLEKNDGKFEPMNDFHVN